MLKAARTDAHSRKIQKAWLDFSGVFLWETGRVVRRVSIGLPSFEWLAVKEFICGSVSASEPECNYHGFVLGLLVDFCCFVAD